MKQLTLLVLLLSAMVLSGCGIHLTEKDALVNFCKTMSLNGQIKSAGFIHRTYDYDLYIRCIKDNGGFNSTPNQDD